MKKIWRWLFPTRYRLVTDGVSWAIKRWDGQFYDLVTPGYWWREGKYMRDCWGTEERARLWYLRLTA